MSFQFYHFQLFDMKRLSLLLLALIIGLGTASAQFEQGKTYIGASASGLGLSYSSNEKFRFGVDALAGKFVSDCLLVNATAGYEHTRYTDDVRLGLGARYYFDQCGIYIGAGAEFNHFTKSNNDLMIPVTVGYAFFINQFLTIEPALYYKMSLHDFSGNSAVGASLGLGFYF